MFKFTDKQIEARSMMAQEYENFMLFGGSRSGKSFLVVYALVVRASKADNSRHVALRFRSVDIEESLFDDTFPKVMRLCFPGTEYTTTKKPMVARFNNGSEIWFGGLDDKERTEKILGKEFATIFLNECSQIPWSTVGIVGTRLAQKCFQNDGVPLRQVMYFDCNPPKKNHWSYKLFVKGVSPDTNEPLKDAHLYGSIQINPPDNAENLTDAYMNRLKNQPAHLKKRFWYGEFGDTNPNALFNEDHFEKWRVEEVPDMIRIVVAVDPSGASDDENENNDAIGIYVAGIGTDGIGYLLEDATIHAGPKTWGRVAVTAYERYMADLIVGEKNFGGEMVKFVIKTANEKVNFKFVTASRGKVVRAEPFSPLFEDGRIRFLGRQPEVEEEICAFSTNGYTGEKSPNRADAVFWCLTELFFGIIHKENDDVIPLQQSMHMPLAG